MNIGANIHRLRRERSVSQAELAFAIGVHQTHISAIESGRKSPSLEVIRRLATYFDVTVAELLGECPEPA